MSFRLARNLGNGGLPIYREKPVAAGQAWSAGAPLGVTANDEWTEAAGADPALATFGAIAEHPVGPGSGALYPTGSINFPPGRAQAVLIRDDVMFTALYTGTLPATPGGSYGIVRGADALWRVDFTDTTATRVRHVDDRWTKAPLSQGRIFVIFLAGTAIFA